ncbi:MAG: restriction endonuclease [Candidatus Obscuribacter sp.]|nr:restriction endonuclease [Candidatus Obscuribacter sp.]
MNDKQFEIFSKEVLRKVHELDGCEVLDSWHNREVDGVSGGKHQIDGYVKIKLPGDVLEIYIEAKNWSTPVSKPNVMTFAGVLADIPGSKKGLIVSRKGFDEGSIWPVCEKLGIGLWTLDKVEEDGNSAHFTVEMVQDGITGIEVWFDQTFGEEEFRTIWDQPDEQVIFYKPDGTALGTRSSLYREMGNRARMTIAPGETISVSFPDGRETFLRAADGKTVRVVCVQGRREQHTSVATDFIRLTHMLRSLTNDDRYFVDQNGKVRRSDEPIDLVFDFPADENGYYKAILQIGLKKDA